jgi:hypothetical protein
VNALTLSSAACPATLLTPPSQPLSQLTYTLTQPPKIVTFLCLTLLHIAIEQRCQFFITKKLDPHHNTSTMATFKIASTRAPTQAEIRDYLLTLNGLDMVHIMRGITEPAAQVAFATKLLLTPPLIVGPNATPEKADKAKKALNAFVGFRCTYNSLPFCLTLTEYICRLLYLNSRLQSVADEEALKPSRSAVGARFEQVTLVIDDKSLVCHA